MLRPKVPWVALAPLSRVLGALALTVSTGALAQRVDPTAMGQGFFDYAKPYVVWSGAAMVVLCVAAAAFFKQFLKEALLTAGVHELRSNFPLLSRKMTQSDALSPLAFG